MAAGIVAGAALLLSDGQMTDAARERVEVANDARPDREATPGAAKRAKPGRKADVCTRTISAGQSAEQLADRLRPGQTGCLRQGVYEGGLTVATPRVTLRSYPGERARITGGQVRIAIEAQAATLKKLILSSEELGPLIYASRSRLIANEITNNHTAICVHLDSYYDRPAPQGVVIRDNRIHDCGELPPANHDHGIYVAHADGTLIRDNLIYDNADRGVQLYPNAQNTQVIGNIIDGNGQGVIFGNASDGSIVRRNIISNSLVRHNVESSASTAADNVVRDNCLWSPLLDYYGGEPLHSGILVGNPGFTVVDNVIADPRFANRVRFRPRSDVCAAVLPPSAR